MVNEATLLKQYSLPTAVTVADGTGLEKGTILILSDPNTGAVQTDVVAAAGVAGVTAAEKVASDGLTKVAIHKDGEFSFYLSGNITANQPVCACLSGGTYANYVQSAAALTLLSGNQIMGYSLESGTNGETIRVRLNLS